MDGRWEGAPGWTVDRYGTSVLVQRFGPGSGDDGDMDALADAIRERIAGAAIWLKVRGSDDPRQRDGRLVMGKEPPTHPLDPLGPRPGRVVVREAGLLFGADLARGQNTGLFLDARLARARVRELAAGGRILNLFSYTGSFGVAAAAAGARSTTNVDEAEGGHERARASFAINGLRADARTHVQSEVFDFLKRAARRDERWDGIVLDPPPFPARRGHGRKRGWDPARDLPLLLGACLERLAVGGWLLAVSAVRGRERFEDHLSGACHEPVPRGADFPGPPEEGCRGWLIRADRRT